MIKKDISLNEDQFRHEIETTVLGRAIVGMIVRPDFVELQLDNARTVRFSIHDGEIAIHLPRVQPDIDSDTPIM